MKNGLLNNSVNPNLNNLTPAGQALFDAKVNKAGDTMTGALTIKLPDVPAFYIKNSNYDYTSSTSETVNVGQMVFKDKNENYIGFLTVSATAENKLKIRVGARRNVAGAVINSFIDLIVDASGNDSLVASGGVKNSIISFIMPNYGAGVSISSGYVAPKSGYVSFFSQGDNGSGSYGYINGREVYVRNIGITSFSRSGAFCNKGDTITFSGGQQKNAIFYPCKGAS